MNRARPGIRSDLSVVLLLVAFGGLLVWDTLTAPADDMRRGPVGPQTMPLLVAGVLLLCAAVLTVEALRGRRPRESDVDATDWRTWTAVIGAILLCAVVIDVAGWVLAGGLMFYLCVYAFGSRHYVRDLVVAAVLALGSFYLFYSGLGIELPAGILQGVL
ncbi:tripartite tricarboxylate transporter TctB family protein [Prauserella cavernicola]|uniref:Tripartite tricarboxylate transporter TctB family protein n=1 Tax=Prauserella cavernicola TaxID=2800127 RepID=A0A934QT83_9PSEU|nr:tripartite tricarboxylate transporter TctB family protein [Prauserella cavernicola]MBK1787822.1 tripartite tricarboxylate transporter TctB family protein [Prauserella cavernicola]